MGIPRKFSKCFKEVSRVFQWSIMWVSKCLKEVQRVFKVFHECFTEVLRVFKEVLRVFQWSFYVVSRKIQGCFKEFFRVFQGRLRGDSRVS